MSGVPTLDFADLSAGPAARDALVSSLGGALEQYGFVSVVGHSVPMNLLDRAYDVSHRTFALPDAAKRAYETPEDGRQRGYTRFGIEHAKDQPIADLKEFWHVGRRVTEQTGPGVPENRFPSEVPDFGPTMEALFDALDRFSLDLLAVVARYLDLPEAYFVERATGGNSLLRLIHYPPTVGAPEGAVRAAAHEDVNLLTVLPTSTAPGLEILDHEGRWLPVDAPRGALICDTGDMMQLVTQGRLPATTHRVVNPVSDDAASSRYSMPFFVHPRPEVRLDAISGTASGPTAEEFLAKRLADIGLVSGDEDA